MLKQRILTAAALIPVVLALILLPPTGFFAAIVALVFVGAAWEWSQLAGSRTSVGRGIVAAVAAVMLLALLLVWTPGLLTALTLAGVAWWIGCCFWLRNFTFAAAPNAENRMLKLGVGVLVIVPTLAAAMALHTSDHGHWWTLLGLVIVWFADTGAYFSGRYLGRRKLAPRISPGKTWAGVYGAIVAGSFITVLGGYLIGVRETSQLVGLGVLGVITVGFAVVGDLFESLMKRHASVKDSGSLFPGHGGLLDRLDSVFAALPIFAAGKLLLGL
ncbi:phosphatidate cytidylyltransferase [Luteibacter rhizovicinus DSM 16549]|uniref:Phosphatidate cytidylyltransferase n=1 Tax=Luteibacter rhizovicinus DSM 16549 TaxID=1440763 RepID=A0A0G9H874_9GAMM|nr:phosphatidate cytidylyltransferase [Luteibacter rhizovicinus]APG02849.1 phosphatidate cytidylyltransferase [Luteibacter rhizovicinus DSM 16549]KLD65798.1 phosphatidate cytidylyltransferase [Luteibacter rhizovicinus DSM 16549]KLD79761.1 phosphatidate cytidylyltransferase [Xanthomonas hyacinthi DSM 19077]